MDYGPGRMSLSGESRYYFWDEESDSGRNHNLGLRADQILTVTILESIFNPADFVTWRTNWVITLTTWGNYN